MRFTKLLFLVGLPVTLALAPLGAAHARPGVYVGGSWGAYSIEDEDFDENDDLLKGFVGLKFSDMFALEVQRVDFDRTDNRNADGEFEGDGNGLAAVLSFPLGTNSALFIKGGQFWWDIRGEFAGIDVRDDGRDPFFGGGFLIGFNDRLSLRLEAERYDIEDIEVDTASVGLQFLF